jgi:hypothetical protein
MRASNARFGLKAPNDSASIFDDSATKEEKAK